MESLSGTPQPAEVLLALSDMPLLTALELRFFMAGFRVSIATDGQEALTLARCLRPVCLVADWRLPRLEGVALLAALHEHPDSRELPVILLLSTPPGPISTRAMDLGAEDVLHKPFPPDLLVAKVRRIAARRPPRAAEGIRGRLRDLPAHDLLQVFVLGGRTAVVRLDTDSERGEIWIDRGRLVAAKLGAIDGLDALKAMIALPDGRFHVEPEVPPPKANLVGTSEWLLLEAMRHRDEARSAK
jgi:DNA-binding response OmpR family regulator